MRLPRILITMNDASDYDGVKLRRDYVRRVVKAGGLPLLPPHGCGEGDDGNVDVAMDAAQLQTWAEAYIEGCDGLLLSGGDDMQPGLYGQNQRLEMEIYPERDWLELALFRAAWQAGRPIFGICRGMQLINVALGGELYQDLDLDFQAGANDCHQQAAAARYQTHHQVEITHSQLQTLLGGQTPVNSHHHQAVSRLAQPLLPAAYAPDGLCEALLSADQERHPLLAVQWHPECLGSMQVLFNNFVRSCSSCGKL